MICIGAGGPPSPPAPPPERCTNAHPCIVQIKHSKKTWCRIGKKGHRRWAECVCKKKRHGQLRCRRK